MSSNSLFIYTTQKFLFHKMPNAHIFSILELDMEKPNAYIIGLVREGCRQIKEKTFEQTPK